MTPKEVILFRSGWAEGLGTYSEFGKLVIGYFNTSVEERAKYFKVLKSLVPRDDVVKTHILASHTAANLESNPEEYGEFGVHFVNFCKMKYFK